MAFSINKASAEERGYDAEHRAERQRYVRLIQSGEVVLCHFPWCGQPIWETNGNLPDGLNLDHNADRTGYRGPAHRDCNIKDGARRGRARQDGQPPRRLVL